MNPSLRRSLAIGIPVLILIAGGFAEYRYLKATAVPKEFQNARADAAVVSDRMVKNSASITSDVNTLNDLSQAKKYKEAQDLINNLSERSKEMREDAITLSNKMEDMANAIPKIRSKDARAAAIEAVNDELILTSHLLNYTELMQKFFTALQLSRTDKAQINIAKGLVFEINSEVGQINDYNDKAREAFEKFDSLTK